MKRIVLAVLVTALIISCKVEKTNFTVFSGKIANVTSSKISILSFPYGEKVKSIKVGKEGSFKDTLKIKNGYYILQSGRAQVMLYIEKGYDFSISIDEKQPKKEVIFSGKGANANNYLFKKNTTEEKGYLGKNSSYALNEKEFLAKKESRKKSFEKELKVIGGNFAKTEQKTLQYEYLNSLLNYKKFHKGVKNKDFLNPLKQIDLKNEEEFKENFRYRELVVKHFYDDVLEESKKTKVPTEKVYLAKVKALKEENIKSGLIAELLRKIGESPYSQEIYEAIMEFSKEDYIRKKAEEKWKKLQSLTKENPSPTFKNYENYKGGKNSLNDFRGKYVYIDVWATWCGSCQHEIPFMKKVEKRYRGKNIVFVSISIDNLKRKKIWQQMVKEKKMTGIQLFADNSRNSKFIKDYEIRGIPRFILIDPKGNIVDSNAPRPSEPQLEQLFKSIGIR